MSHTTDSMTFEIFVGISFSSLFLFPGHGDIQKVSYMLNDRLITSLKIFSKTTVDVYEKISEKNGASRGSYATAELLVKI